MKKLPLDAVLDRALSLLRVHLPCYESDPVLNIAYYFLAGDTCKEHLELRPNDEA